MHNEGRVARYLRFARIPICLLIQRAFRWLVDCKSWNSCLWLPLREFELQFCVHSYIPPLLSGALSEQFSPLSSPSLSLSVTIDAHQFYTAMQVFYQTKYCIKNWLAQLLTNPGVSSKNWTTPILVFFLRRQRNDERRLASPIDNALKCN